MGLLLLFMLSLFIISTLSYWVFKAQKEAINSLNIKKQLQESEEKYKKLFKKNKAVELIIDASSKQITDANDSALKFYGYSLIEITSLKISDINILSEEEISHEMELAKSEQREMFNFKHKLSSGIIKDVEVYSGPIEMDEKQFLYSIVFDISNRIRLEEIVKLRHDLLELVYIGDSENLLQFALDKAEALTGSQIGFFHFVEENQENISLQVWSKNTLGKMCFTEEQGKHCSLSKAGVWIECIRQRHSVIHNDYEALPHKNGLPEGHPKMVRELTVPVFKDGVIVAIVGVGNKELDYDSDDVKIVQQIADMAYDYSERLRVEKKIEFMAYYDVLTGLPNRTLLTDRMKQAIAIHKRANQFLAVCYIDLDGFKPINDQYGHHVGDMLLILLAERLQEHLRDGDTLSRIGGDEFVLVITGLVMPDGYKEVVEDVLNTINTPFEIEGKRIHVSSSIGVTVFPIDNKDTDELLRHANQAMYQAKEEGKSKYKLYQFIRDEESKLNEKLLQEFAIALKENQLVLYYQPKVDLLNGSIIGFEALVRWQHPKNGLMFPNQFLPLIENTSFEIELDEWVFTRALSQKREFDKLDLPLSISININPRYLQMQGFVTFVTTTLALYPKEFAKSIEIEVLEVASIKDTKKASKIMDACKELGIKFSLDDFGTGYASLSHLHELPIDILKIDQEFVKNMFINKSDLDIVEGVLKLADALKKPVIAEGVESIEIGLMLLLLGCKYAQGYAIARPMPQEDIQNWIKHWQQKSIWYQLQSEKSSGISVYDIDVAIFSHKKWLNNVIEYVTQASTEPNLPALQNECSFGFWYKGVGRAKYGSKESYKAIDTEHSHVHTIALQMVQFVQSDKKEEAIALIDALNNCSDRLIKLLYKLAKQ
jgi:diguanylate cyclase (GGDEF)-like protein/PAS domain S-box-containing protein